MPKRSQISRSNQLALEKTEHKENTGIRNPQKTLKNNLKEQFIFKKQYVNSKFLLKVKL